MKNVTWYGQGSIKIVTDGKVIYIDPFMISEEMRDADIILITHPHFDHLSVDDIEKVVNENTVFAATNDCVEEIKENFANEIVTVGPDEEHIIKDTQILTVPAYNIVKTQFHPKEKNWVGYIIQTQEGKYYYTGDTEKIPEMNALDIDIIFLPLGQTYTMSNIEEAANTAKVTGAKTVIPVHYGTYEGTQGDVLTLKILLEPEIKVVELPRA